MRVEGASLIYLDDVDDIQADMRLILAAETAEKQKEAE